MALIQLKLGIKARTNGRNVQIYPESEMPETYGDQLKNYLKVAWTDGISKFHMPLKIDERS